MKMVNKKFWYIKVPLLNDVDWQTEYYNPIVNMHWELIIRFYKENMN